MSDDRKYKQRGYQDHDGRPGPRPQAHVPGAPRIPVITQYKETVRCAECGHELGTLFEILAESRCARCGADLHTCRNCRHFDTSARFQCAQPITERVAKKAAANDCRLFTPRTIVVKELNEAAGAAPAAAPVPAHDPAEARAALEKLFKK